MSYVFEDIQNGTRIGFASNSDWQQEYIKHHLIDGCHIWQSVTGKFIKTQLPFLALPWECVKAQTPTQKDIYLYRQDFFIGDGISFCTQVDGKREYLALCPDISDTNFLSEVSRNVNLIKDSIKTFRHETEVALIRNEKIGFSNDRY